MVKQRLVFLAAAFAVAGNSLAGGLLTNTNQNVVFLRNPARDAAIGIDGLPTQYDPFVPGMNGVVIVLFCVIPMVAWAATLLAMKNYPLTGARMKEIQAINACRRDAIA